MDHFTCETCGAEFRSFYNASQHEKRHKAAEAKAAYERELRGEGNIIGFA